MTMTPPLPPSPPALLQVLRAITEVFGQDMWFSTVLLLTHGGAPPPDSRCGRAAAAAPGQLATALPRRHCLALGSLLLS